jgi:hypothetical protein
MQWIGAGSDSAAPVSEATDTPQRSREIIDSSAPPPATAMAKVDEPPPEPVEPAPVESAPVVQAGSLTIPEHGVGTRIENNRLVGQADRFTEGTRVWFWTRVLGGTRGQTIRHVWMLNGRVIDKPTLRLGGPHWRTHSRKTLYPGSAGSWAVEARDEAGNVLARTDFTCTP